MWKISTEIRNILLLGIAAMSHHKIAFRDNDVRLIAPTLGKVGESVRQV